MKTPDRQRWQEQTAMTVEATDTSLGELANRAVAAIEVNSQALITPSDARSDGRSDGERYEELGEIGRGGTASVHRVLDRVLLRDVAMKLLQAEVVDDGHKLRSFLKEAQITAQLEHPNIPPVHDLSPETQRPFHFTMKLIDGKTLGDMAEPFPVATDLSRRLRELLPVLLKVCDAVAFAHSRGVIHRDIKPENIMVGSFGEVYLMDWGLAKLLGRAADGASPVALRSDLAFAEQSERRYIAGTPAYMAPEQAQARVPELDERSDVFNLGGILYFIMTGRAPYAGCGVREALRRAAFGQYTPLDEHQTPFPPSLGRIIEKALALKPEERHQSALELKHDVERFLRSGLHLPLRTFLPGEKILVQGDVGDAAYIIARGRCVVYRSKGEERNVLRELGPGEVFGEMGMLVSGPRSATVEALEPVTVTVVTRALLDEAFGVDSWMGALVRTVVDRFRDIERRLYAVSEESDV